MKGNIEEVHTQFMKTRTHITPGYGLPMVDEDPKRLMGLCLHHSYVPELPANDRNYAEIFNEFHFGQIKDWKWDGQRWVNPDGSWHGLRYDFVITWTRNGRGRGGCNPESRYWTSYRWIVQLGGGHSRNTKRKTWKNGSLIYPNTQLVSVCMVGNFDKYVPPRSVVERIREIAKATGVKKNLFFHRDFDYKSCPGAKVHFTDMNSMIFGDGLSSKGIK
jgi:hypothetical protein